MLVAGFLGLTVGLILALTGAGGGILAVPLLMFALTWDITQAAPVALLAVGASAALGAVIGLRQRVVRYRAAMLIAVTGSVVTPLGVLLAHAAASGNIVAIVTSSIGFVGLIIVITGTLKINDWNLYSSTLGLVNFISTAFNRNLHRVTTTIDRPARTARCRAL